MVWSCRIQLVALPTAERYGRNPQSASSFRLEYLQLEAASPEVAADGCRCFWNLYSTVVGW
jgi:hypothetical protein